MLEILRFVLSDFWTWLGTVVLLSYLPGILRAALRPLDGIVTINHNHYSEDKKQ